MKSKFELDIDSGTRVNPSPRLIDPEAYDASEQQFAASIEEKPAPLRFVVDEPAPAESRREEFSSEPDQLSTTAVPAEDSAEVAEELETAAPVADHTGVPGSDSGSWRNEVAARVGNYRARRRPRAPRYPSLQLKFDAPEPSTAQATIAPSRLAVAMQASLAAPQEEQAIQPQSDEHEGLRAPESGARIIEFPRSASAPPLLLDELAEPVMDRPRILEVPDILLPPPALGGILIEAAEQPAQERRPGFELPLQAAPMSKRLLAGGADCLVVLAAFGVFAYIFFRITSLVPAVQQAVAISASLIALFWITYQYILLVYCGTTPGLKLANLHLSRFDGTAVPRTIRQWRALASVLSGFSLALGYAWCFLDEDRLCWHDRITRTYMAPSNRTGTGP
jgi:uncharacterized RDD family membrane protein YckC